MVSSATNLRAPRRRPDPCQGSTDSSETRPTAHRHLCPVPGCCRPHTSTRHRCRLGEARPCVTGQTPHTRALAWLSTASPQEAHQAPMESRSDSTDAQLNGRLTTTATTSAAIAVRAPILSPRSVCLVPQWSSAACRCWYGQCTAAVARPGQSSSRSAVWRKRLTISGHESGH